MEFLRLRSGLLTSGALWKAQCHHLSLETGNKFQMVPSDCMQGMEYHN